MKKTKIVDVEDPILVTPEGARTRLQGAGRKTIEKIASDAGAIVRVGRRVFINMVILEDYLKKIATE